MGAQDVRSFLGGRHNADRGSYVSAGGFSKEANYEAERASIATALRSLDDLVCTLIEYYEKLDNETKCLVPLGCVY
jgi:restriction system protein